MARVLSQTLTLGSQSTSHLLSATAESGLLRPSSRLLNLRRRSNAPEKVQFVEVDLGEVDAASGSGVEVDFVGGMRRLEDAIHGIIVKRSAPAWLPFLPGASYWVPPRNKSYSHGMVELVGRLANTMTDEELRSLRTVRGWPSSSYFIEGVLPHSVEEYPEKNNVKSDEEEA